MVVPVDIDTARPAGSTGMVDAMLAFTYDPSLYEVSTADVRLGTVPMNASGWHINSQVNDQTGLIGVELYSNTPITSTSGGSLVTISLHSRGDQAAGPTALQLVPYVDPTGGLRVYQTQLSDAQGAFVLHIGQGGEVAAGSERTQEGTTALAAEGGLKTIAGGMTGADTLLAVPPSSETRAALANITSLLLPFQDEVFGDPEQLADALLPLAPFDHLPWRLWFGPTGLAARCVPQMPASGLNNGALGACGTIIGRRNPNPGQR